MNRLCIICARGGSKGVKNKNLRKINGSSLIALAIKQARTSKMFEKIAMSSDSELMLEEAKQAGADYIIPRPAELASDTIDKSPAVIHCAKEAEKMRGQQYETFVDIDVTAPLRKPSDIAAAIKLLEDKDADNVFSVCPARRSPYFNMVERNSDGRIELCKSIDPPIVRRQDAPPTYDLNAAIYAWPRRVFFEYNAPLYMPKTEIYVMPEESAYDLDTEHDFTMIKLLYGIYMEKENV